MKLSDFKVGGVYTLGTQLAHFRCEAVVSGYPVLISNVTKNPFPFIVMNCTGWSEVQEWVVLMWGTDKKNSVIVNSEFFPSEQSAINKWVEHPCYIGTHRVK